MISQDRYEQYLRHRVDRLAAKVPADRTAREDYALFERIRARVHAENVNLREDLLERKVVRQFANAIRSAR